MRAETLQTGDETEIEATIHYHGECMTTYDAVFHLAALLQAFENHFVNAGMARDAAKKATEAALAAYKDGLFRKEV